MMKIDKSVQITGTIAVALIVVTWLIVNTLSGFSPSETITVEGVSSVSVVPDEISVYFSAETLEDSADLAKDKNAVIVANVKTALIDAGFERDDFETSNFNVREEFDWSEDGRDSLGFKATHSIIVRMSSEDEGMIGVAVDAAVDNGALLSYVNFELSQDLENEYKALAMKSAAEDARVKGEAVADGLGARLGKVVSTSSSDFGYRPWLAYSEVAMDGASMKGEEVATNIQVGEQEISSRISVTYKIK
ncbi:SIMPL domain-containing protein [Methanococcoides sp. SA1]|nr:SIMPL domain-containing protein [Methanococcoides sp. SA1]